MGDPDVKPMFPLGTVLLPGVAVPLQVFEPRYLALVDHCLATEPELGSVLIERGSEVGGGDTRTLVGTLGRIVEARELRDGRWGILLVGTHRIRVLRWLPDDPYPRAEVELWPDEDGSGGIAVEDLASLLRRVLALKAEVGDPAAPATTELDADPVLATWQAASASGLGPADLHDLLVIADAPGRARALVQLLEDEEQVLRQRILG